MNVCERLQKAADEFELTYGFEPKGLLVSKEVYEEFQEYCNFRQNKTGYADILKFNNMELVEAKEIQAIPKQVISCLKYRIIF